MLKNIPLPLALCGLLLAASPAAAEDANPKWFVRAGVTRLKLADKIQLNFAGAPVPGAGVHTPPHYTPTVQVGRFLTDHVAIALTAGIPPHIAIDGRGSLQPFGRLAETTYGPAVLTVQYHPLRTGPVRPYLGVGAAYMIIFSTKDGAFQNVSIANDLAPALEGGTDLMVSRQVGLFLDVKKAFLRTTARGTFGGAPVVGKVRLDPLALTAGVAFHF
jgi:outer membrane protein